MSRKWQILALIALIAFEVHLAYLITGHWDAVIPILPTRKASLPVIEAHGVPIVDGELHPIPQLFEAAREAWNAKVARQSKTLAEAVETYRQRYNRNPPKGFDIWYNFAAKNKAVLVDEYDRLNRDLEPFWRMEPAKIRHHTMALLKQAQHNAFRVVDIKSMPNKTMVCDVLAGNEVTPQSMPRAINVCQVVESLDAKMVLKQMFLPINELANPRVLPSAERMSSAVLEVHNASAKVDARFIWPRCPKADDFSDTTIPYLKDACPLSSPIQAFDHRTGDLNVQIPIDNHYHFVRDQERKDICQRPDFLRYNNGLWSNAPFTTDIFPMFSYGKLEPYSDILIPPYFHYDLNDYTLRPEDGPAWQNKTPTAYWRGSCEFCETDTNLDAMHRQRLVSLNFNRSIPVYGASNTGIASFNPSFNLPRHLDIAFSKPYEWYCIYLNNSNPTVQRMIKKNYRWTTHQSSQSMQKHKFLFDVDGWGYSARFKSILASSSVPLKVTVWEEWFTERLLPWYHFVPVSASLREAPQIMAYFVGDGHKLAAHDELAKRIADAGSDFVRKHLRIVDQELYVFRLILEWQRLIDDRRDAGDYDFIL